MRWYQKKNMTRDSSQGKRRGGRERARFGSVPPGCVIVDFRDVLRDVFLKGGGSRMKMGGGRVGYKVKGGGLTVRSARTRVVNWEGGVRDKTCRNGRLASFR